MDRVPRVTDAADRQLRSWLAPMTPTDDRNGFARSHRASYIQALDPDSFREPAIIGWLLTHVGIRRLGRHEKLAWEYPFLYDGIPCSIALEKFGLRLYVARFESLSANDAMEVARQIQAVLRRAVGFAERRVLNSFGESQLASGNVTMLNQSRRLRALFDYFQQGAEAAYGGRGRLPKKSPDGWTRLMPEAQEGFYNTFAMVVAYFSWLEHVLVLALPFAPDSGLTPLEFVSRRWREKFKTLIPLTDPKDHRAYQRLNRLSEDYRNPWAHGALDPRHGSIAFHLPGFGAVSAGIRPSDLSPVFYPVPFGAPGFKRAVGELAAVDRYLRSEAPITPAMKWIGSGLDVAFDTDSRQRYRSAIEAGDAAFEEFIKASVYWSDQHDNMDW